MPRLAASMRRIRLNRNHPVKKVLPPHIPNGMNRAAF